MTICFKIYKNLIISLLLLVMGVGSVRAAAYTWTGATSTDWATATNWAPNGNPGSAAGDIVTIGIVAFTSGNQPTLSVAPTNALASITLGTATASYLTISANYSIGNLTIGAGSTVSESGIVTVTFTGDILNNGTYTASTGLHTFATNAINLYGTLSIPNMTTSIAVVNNGSLTVGTALAGAGTLTNMSTGTLSLGGTCGITTFRNGGTTTITGSGNITTTTANFVNNHILNLQGSGNITGITNSNGGVVNLSSSGTITTFTNGNACTLNISALSVPTISTLTVTASGNVVNYNGAGAQAVKAQAYLNLTLSGSGDKSIIAVTSVTNKMSIAPDAGGAKASIAAGVNIAVRALFLGGVNSAIGTWGYSGETNNSTVYFANTTGYLTVAVLSPIVASAPGNWSAIGTWTGGAIPGANDDVAINVAVTVAAALTTTGSVTINNGGTLTCSFNGAQSFGSITINNGGALTASRPFTVNGTTSITGTITLQTNISAYAFNGDVTLNSGANWNSTVANTFTITGSFANNATTLTPSTGVYTFSGAGQAFSGGTTTSIGSVAVTGTYINSGTLTVGTALSGVGTLINTGTLNIGGTSGTCSITALANTTGTIAFTGSGAISTLLANFENTGTINLGGTGTIAGITNNVGGTVYLNSSGTITAFNNNASSTLNISTTPTITTLTATATGNTVNYNGTGAQTVLATNYYNLGFSGAHTTTSITSSGGVGIAGNLTNTATFSSGNFVLTGSTYTFNGTGAQNINALGTTAFPTLTINKVSGIATLTSAVSATAFNLTVGTFDPATFLLTTTTPTFANTAGNTLRVGGTNWASNYSVAITEPALGTIEYYAGTQTINDVSYGGNLKITGTGTKTWTQATTAKTVTGNLTIGDGTTLSVGGAFAWTVTGTTTIGDGTNGALATLAITNASGTKTFTGAVTINNDGFFNETAAAQLAFGGNVTINTTGTTVGGSTLTENTTAVVGIAGSLLNNGTYNASSGVHTFSGAGKTISGTTANTIGSVAITSTITNSGTLTVATALSGAGTLTNTGTLNIGGTCSVATLTNNGSVTSTGSGAITTATLTNNLTWNMDGTGTVTAFTNSANGVLTISATPTVPAFTALTASAVGSTVNFDGAGPQTVKASAYSNLTLSGSGVKSILSGTSVTSKMSIAPSGGGATASIWVGGTLAARALFLGGVNQPVGSHSYALDGPTYFANTTGIINVTVTSPITSVPAGGAWATAATWVGANAPTASDDVLIANTSGSVTIGAIATCANLTINDGSTLSIGGVALTVSGTTTVGGGTSGTLTMTSATGTKTFTGAVTINAGGLLTENGYATPLSFGSDVNITGTLTEAGAAVVGIAGSLTNNGTYTASTGVHTFSGAGKTISGTTINTIPSVAITGTITNSGTLTIATALTGAGGLTNTGTLNIGGTSTITTLTATANGNTVSYNGTGAQTIKTTNYYNLDFTGAHTTNSITSTGAVGVAGSLTNTATFSSGNFILTGSTYTFNGTGAQNINALGTVAFPILTINKASGIATLTSAVSATTFNLTDGTFDPATFLLTTTTPTFANIAGNTLRVGGTNWASNYSVAITEPTLGTIEYDATGDQTVNGVTHAGNLTLSGSGTKTVGGPLTTVNGDLTINSGVTLLIPPAKCVTVNGIINSSNADNIYIQSSSGKANGSLIFPNASNTNVQATVDMYSQAYANTLGPPPSDFRWQYFGIPVISVATASPTFDGSYVRSYSEGSLTANGKWTQLTNSSSLTEFQGYEITQPLPTTIQFKGTLENGNKTIPLTYSGSSDHLGKNIVSNSYTATIDIRQLIFGTNTENTVYLYNTGSYNDWNNNSSTIPPQDSTVTTPGQYISIPKNAAGTGLIPYSIPSMSGFLVNATGTGAYLTINYSSVLPNVVPQRAPQSKNFGTGSGTDKVYMAISVKGKHFGDYMWLINEPGTTHGFDNGWDGYKLTGAAGTPQLYAIEESGNLQVSTSEDMNNTYLGFQAGVDTEYTLTFTHHNTASKYTVIYLVDLVENKTIDITTDSTTYTFNATSSDATTRRFKITTLSSHNNEPDATSRIKIFSSANDVFIQNLDDSTGDIQIFDITGRYLKGASIIPNGITKISGLHPGTYVARAKTNTEQVSKRLIVGN